MSKQDIARKIGELESQLKEEKKKLEAVSNKSIGDMLAFKRAEMSFNDFWWKFFYQFVDANDFIDNCVRTRGEIYPQKTKLSNLFSTYVKFDIKNENFEFFDVKGKGLDIFRFIQANDIDVSIIQEQEFIEEGGCMQSTDHLLLFDGDDVYTIYRYSNSWESGGCDKMRKVSEVKEKREWVVCY